MQVVVQQTGRPLPVRGGSEDVAMDLRPYLGWGEPLELVRLPHDD